MDNPWLRFETLEAKALGAKRRYKTPVEVLDRNCTMELLYYSHFESASFRAFIAVDALGSLCYGSLGNSERDAIVAMKRDFAGKKQFSFLPVKRGKSSSIDTTVDTFAAVLDDPRKSLLLGAKIRYIFGTSLQKRVWKYLVENTRNGETVSYKQIAQGLGIPGAFRVVANACAANRIALVVPCHRVLTSKGENTGYRWGKELKERILESEKKGSVV